MNVYLVGATADDDSIADVAVRTDADTRSASGNQGLVPDVCPRANIDRYRTHQLSAGRHSRRRIDVVTNCSEATGVQLRPAGLRKKSQYQPR